MVTKIVSLLVLLHLTASAAFSGNYKTLQIARTRVSMAENKNEQQTIGQMLGGLVFLKTSNREAAVKFYMNRIGMAIWLEQPNITILSHGNMVLGFHQTVDDGTPDLHGMYTFVYPSIEQVDEMYRNLQDIADGCPRYNERYRIYQFFAKDPEGRNLEFQAFLHPLMNISSSYSSVT